MLHFLFRKNLPAGCTIALHMLVIVLSLLLPSLRHTVMYLQVFTFYKEAG